MFSEPIGSRSYIFANHIFILIVYGPSSIGYEGGPLGSAFMLAYNDKMWHTVASETLEGMYFLNWFKMVYTGQVAVPPVL